MLSKTTRQQRNHMADEAFESNTNRTQEKRAIIENKASTNRNKTCSCNKEIGPQTNECITVTDHSSIQKKPTAGWETKGVS